MNQKLHGAVVETIKWLESHLDSQPETRMMLTRLRDGERAERVNPTNTDSGILAPDDALQALMTFAVAGFAMSNKYESGVRALMDDLGEPARKLVEKTITAARNTAPERGN